MIAYRYKISTKDGQTESGRIEADSMEIAENNLSSRGRVISIVPLLVAKAQVVAPTAAPKAKVKRNKKVRQEDIIAVLRNMAVMAESGVPLKESLDTVSEETAVPDLTNALRQLRDDVVAGSPLADAMRKSPKMFPSIICDMVSVGEDGGRMDVALTTAAEHLERSAEMRAKIINALIYPAILTVTSMASVGALVIFVVPNFVQTFTQMGIEPPALTKFLMFIGGSFRYNPILTVVVLVGLAVGARWSLKQPKVSEWIGLRLLKMPIVGELLFKIAVARAMFTLASLTAANIHLVDALTHAAKVAGVPTLRDALNAAHLDLQRGETLAESLSRSGVLPHTMVQLIGIGERTGKLPGMLLRAAKQIERDSDARLKSVVSLFEPILIVVMGAIIGVITLSIITPLFTLIQKF